MSDKKISSVSKPRGKHVADANVGRRTRSSAPARVAATDEAPVAIKRLTIDIPASLHRRIKVACASRGTKITDEVRELLLSKYGES